MTKPPVVIAERDHVLAALRSRRAWTLIVVGAVVGAALGIVWLVNTPRIFKATAAVELTSVAPQVNISTVGARPDPVTIDTDAQLVTSDVVVDAVAQTHPRDRADVRDNLSVSARPLSQVMTITYSADSPSHALDGANAAARVFLSEKERLVVEPVHTYLQEMATQSATPAEAGTSLNEPTDDLWALESQRQAAVAAGMRMQGPGQVLEEARITVAGSRGAPELPVVSGAMLGALLGLVVALIGMAMPVPRR